jgi:hypothetical protein
MLCESKRLKCFSNLFKLRTVLSRGGALFWGTLYLPRKSVVRRKSLSGYFPKFWNLSSSGVREWPI